MSSFPPKECGIATFTEDLVTAMNKKFNPVLKSKVIALTEKAEMYNYGEDVLLELNKDDIDDFILTAKKINENPEVKLVCIQHEFGLFGGGYGNYIIPFLETVEKPVVITFHSVLPDPDENRQKIVRFICSKCAAIVVMAESAIEILNKDYDVPKEKIHVVHHGIPSSSLIPSNYFKKKLKLENRTVLSTFGLLSKGKGVEYMIKSLPKLVKKYPDLLYIIMGETHPVVRKKGGEKYRNKLMKLVGKLGLHENVKFYNKYLTLQQIVRYLLASDIYVCTNLERNQISSGTLSYALGCGKAIVSTPILYAEEMLANDRGVLAEFKNPASYTKAIDKILRNPQLKSKIERNAYAFGRKMIWPNVATRYLNIFNKVVKLRDETVSKFPKIKLNHLKNLTNHFGCIQFSKLTKPDKKSGYTVDDNARALIAASLHHHLSKSEHSYNLVETYLDFLEKVQEDDGNFKNNLENKNEILRPRSEDAFGRTLWALGYTLSKFNVYEDPWVVKKAKTLFDRSYKFTKKVNSPRAKAFSIIGLYYYNQKYKDRKIVRKIKKLADSLVRAHEHENSKDWKWFEKYITYSNSKLPESLFLAYDLTKNPEYLTVGKRTLNFLSKSVFIDDCLSPIGQKGWMNRNGKRAFFDQQPVDASSLVQTYLIAYEVTGIKDYYNKAVLAFNWFLGKNHLKQMMYDEKTGGCYDGLGKETVNLNQGAESTIAYLMARLMLEEFKIKEMKQKDI